MEKREIRPIRSVADIVETSAAFQKSRILLTALELGVFDALGDRSLTGERVAEAIGAEPKATERFLNAVCAFGLLVKRGNLFRNSPLSARRLVKGKPGYMAELRHKANTWGAWSLMTDSVRAGVSPLASKVGHVGRMRIDDFIAMMHEQGLRQSPSVVSSIDLKGVRRVLDVGAGSGVYSMAFARARGGIRVTAFDLPRVKMLIEKYVAEAGLAARVTPAGGNYLADDLGSGFDLVFLSSVVHTNPPADNIKLIRKCHAALAPGGRLVVQDFILDSTRTRPVVSALFTLTMLIATKAGDTYTRDEIKGWMREAGFSGFMIKDLPSGKSLIIGRKK